MQQTIIKQIQRSIEIKQKLLGSPVVLSEIERTAETAISVFKAKNKIMLAGNGGSAADAQHIAAEFVNRFCFDRPALPAVALTTDTSVITAIGNDSSFDKVFARQIMAIGNKGDMFIGISTSGNSKNIIEALDTCREAGITAVGLTNENGGMMKEKCDICIQIPSLETPRIQEVHILVGHIICSIIEEELFGSFKH